MSKPRCLIIGSNISGLITAHAAALVGWCPIVFEKEKQLAKMPYAIPLWANGAHALRQLHLGDFVDEQCAPIESVFIKKKDGSVLYEKKGTTVAGNGEILLRSLALKDLQEKLAKPLVEQGLVRFGHKFLGHTDHVDIGKVTANFENDHKEDGMVLLGCDGSRSAVRGDLHRLLQMDTEALYACSSIHGTATIKNAQLEPGCWRYWSPPPGDVRLHMLSMPRSNQVSFSLFVKDKDPKIKTIEDSKLGETQEELLQIVRQKTEGFGEAVGTVMKGIDVDSLESVSHYDMEQSKFWGEGPVSFVGDAIHGLHPELMQNACLAFEDAVSLAIQLSRVIPEIHQGARLALRSYEGDRFDRCYWVQNRSRDIFRQSTPQHRFGEKFRDSIVAPALQMIETKLLHHKSDSLRI